MSESIIDDILNKFRDITDKPYEKLNGTCCGHAAGSAAGNRGDGN
jgi:hypothetical protein